LVNLAEVEAAKRAWEDAREELAKWTRIEYSTREWFEEVKQN